MEKLHVIFWTCVTFFVGLLQGLPGQAMEFTNIEKIKMDLHEDEIAISFIQLSSGEATLVQSQDENILINTGSNTSQKELLDKLRVFDVKSIDKLIITHNGPSYIGNLDTIVKKYDISKIYTSHPIVHDLCRNKNVPYCFLFDVWSTGMHYPLDALHADVTSVSEAGALNILFSFGKNTLYYMGFADSQHQKDWVKKHKKKTHIIKVNEYGNGKEFNDSFLEHVDPDIAIFFHHPKIKPNSDLVTQIESDWTQIYQLKDTGTITILMNLDSYELRPYY